MTLFSDTGIVGLSAMVVVMLLMLVGWAAAMAWRLRAAHR